MASAIPANRSTVDASTGLRNAFCAKASINSATPRPFYNKAKELLFQDKQITSYTLSTYDPDLYCELRKHFDYVWFEMQHSTMSYDEVRRMLLACPGRDGAAPMIRMPDALGYGITGMRS